MKNIISYLLTCLLMCVCVTAQTENLGPHSHGLATLTLALENDTLEIQFESPSVNLIGFEHKAKSQQEKQLVTQAEAVLRSPKRLFLFVGANCEPKETTIDVSEVMDGENEQHEHQHHSKDHADGHSEITASYRFNCSVAKHLNSVSIALFDYFSGVEKINAVWVTGLQQGAALLSHNENEISLRAAQ